MANDLKNIPILPLAAAGIGFWALYKVFQKFGIIKTASDRAESASIEQSQGLPDDINFFSPTAKIPKGSTILTDTAAKNFAKYLYDSAHWYGDDEERIYNAFRNMPTQAAVTSLSRAFSKYYKKDLYFWLKSVLSTSELATVLQIVKSKPKLKKK